MTMYIIASINFEHPTSRIIKKRQEWVVRDEEIRGSEASLEETKAFPFEAATFLAIRVDDCPSCSLICAPIASLYQAAPRHVARNMTAVVLFASAG